MRRAPDRFVTFADDQVLRQDTIYPMPERVAVLVGQGCASSCENFVMDARQSDKVTVLGAERTRGMGDYGNVRSLWLPGWRRLRIPTSRSRRLLEEGPLDRVGLDPEVRVPTAAPAMIAFALDYLRSAPRSVAP